MERSLLLKLIILFSYTFFLVFATINIFNSIIEDSSKIVLVIFLVLIMVLLIPSESDLTEYIEAPTEPISVVVNTLKDTH
jgi:hypothetical protein